MSRLICCVICEDNFDPRSLAKKRTGGLYNHCPSCSQETEVKHLGLAASDGKFAQITILSFSTQEDREKYKSFHQNNSGLHKGKSCQLGNHLSTTPAVRFKTVQAFKPTNHKGKSV